MWDDTWKKHKVSTSRLYSSYYYSEQSKKILGSIKWTRHTEPHFRRTMFFRGVNYRPTESFPTLQIEGGFPRTSRCNTQRSSCCTTEYDKSRLVSSSWCGKLTARCNDQSKIAIPNTFRETPAWNSFDWSVPATYRNTITVDTIRLISCIVIAPYECQRERQQQLFGCITRYNT